MGVNIVVGGAPADEVSAVRALFDVWNRTFSPFLTGSELSRVNRAETLFVGISPLFARVLAAALDAARTTDGLVDPTLGRGGASWTALRLSGALLMRPPGVTLDLNGVVKGLAADEALALAPGAGFLAAGGDIAVRRPTVVGLAGGGSFRLSRGGVATSGTTRWPDHLIDPRTGEASTSRWREVTVVGSTCLEADVAAKAAFLLGDDGPAWLDERGLPGLFVDRRGRIPNHAWRDALGHGKAA